MKLKQIQKEQHTLLKSEFTTYKVSIFKINVGKVPKGINLEHFGIYRPYKTLISLPAINFKQI